MVILDWRGSMRLAGAMILLAAGGDLADARGLPLPRPRPQLPGELARVRAPEGEVPSQPSACRLRLTAERAVASSLPPIQGPGECEAPDVVRLEAVVLPDRGRIAVDPPAIVRCTMAEAIAGWVREDAAPRVRELGSPLKAITSLGSFDCRDRNGEPGTKVSEHGKANAIDLHSLRLANGQVLELTDRRVPKDFREDLRKSMCARFTTVLGPGSDGYHEDHVHVDLAERRGGYRICQWDVPEPGQQTARATPEEGVPLPPARPADVPAERSDRKHRRGLSSPKKPNI